MCGVKFLFFVEKGRLIKDSGKFGILDNFIQKCNLQERKILIYTQIKEMIELLEVRNE